MKSLKGAQCFLLQNKVTLYRDDVFIENLQMIPNFNSMQIYAKLPVFSLGSCQKNTCPKKYGTINENPHESHIQLSTV